MVKLMVKSECRNEGAAGFSVSMATSGSKNQWLQEPTPENGIWEYSRTRSQETM